MSALEEFQRQVENLARAGVDTAGLDPLREVAAKLPEPGAGTFPFLLVPPLPPRDVDTTMLDDADFEAFQPIDGVEVPPGPAYLAVGVSTGTDLRNVTPDDAVETIGAEGRSPLTLEEGLALLAHFPESVAKNAGFSLPGSRCGDRRVTALWISKGKPKLGWCWAGNPHTWLGSASCERRLAS